MLLWAPTGVGKSLFALSAAIAVAGGGKLLGWTAGKRNDDDDDTDATGWRVLYIDGEMNLGDIQERLRGLLAGAERTDSAKVLNNLTLLSRQGQADAEWFPSITDPEGVAFYRGLVMEHKADMIVFDNFSTLGEVEDENAAASFNAIVQTLLSLKQLGVATMLVHHAGKNGETFRGSSKLGATFEIIMQLAAAGKDASDRGASFLTVFEKMRSGMRPPEVAATLETIDTFEGQRTLRWQHITATNARLYEIRDGLTERRWGSQKEIAEELGVNESTITRDIQAGILLQLWTKPEVATKLREGAARAAAGDVLTVQGAPGGSGDDPASEF